MRTMSTYSRVRVERPVERLPVPALDDLRAGDPEPSTMRPLEMLSSVAAVIAVIAGVRAGIWKIPEAILRLLGVRRQPGQHRRRIDP